MNEFKEVRNNFKTLLGHPIDTFDEMKFKRYYSWGFVIVLLLAFVFKDKEKAYKKMINKMVKKGVITAEEEDEYSYADEGEQENLFSTMD